MAKNCDPSDIAIKSFFLGPKAENAPWLTQMVIHILTDWFDWRRQTDPHDGLAIGPNDQRMPQFQQRLERVEKLLFKLEKEFSNELPKFSPRYIGHMFSEISMPALLGHFLTLLHNPNNVAGESSRVGVKIEREAISDLAKMVSFSPRSARGHFTSGGTVANLEAIYRAKRLAGKKKLIVMVAPNTHYSWPKLARLIGLKSSQIMTQELDRYGRVDLNSLRKSLKNCVRQRSDSMLFIVSTTGTTSLGSVDSIDKINIEIQRARKSGLQIWHHIDGAYGAFFCASLNNARSLLDKKTQAALRAVKHADSITVDPHKLGYVPYSSGAFIARTNKLYQLSADIDMPYLDIHHEKDAGTHTIEGSRSAAGSVATWLTSRSIGLDRNGYGRILDLTLNARHTLEAALSKSKHVQVLQAGDLNVLCLAAGRPGEKLSRSNKRIQKIFKTFSPRKNSEFYVSKTSFKFEEFPLMCEAFLKQWNPQIDVNEIETIRLCIMNPFFLSKEPKVDFVKSFVRALEKAAMAAET